MSVLRQHLADLPEPDAGASGAVRERAGQVLRPSGALARLDEVAVCVAAWQGTDAPRIERPAGLVFAADHGVAAAAPVSAYPPDVTAAMASAVGRGVATISVFARGVGATLDVIDVGVGDPTGDIRTSDALSTERFDEVTRTAFAAVEELDADLLVLGELGIGNTTAAAALAAALLGGDTDRFVGRGTGVDGEAHVAKRDAVRNAVDRVRHLDDPLEVLRSAGGAELVAMAAAVVAARRRRLPVVLDGYICTASAAMVAAAVPGTLDHCLAGHRSAEPGHRLLLDHLDLHPLLELDMRLGEGSGAMAAVPLIRLACAGVVDVQTFDEFFAGAGGSGADDAADQR